MEDLDKETLLKLIKGYDTYIVDFIDCYEYDEPMIYPMSIEEYYNDFKDLIAEVNLDD